MQTLILGGVPSTNGFLGCMKEIVIDGMKIDPLSWKLNEVNQFMLFHTHIYELRIQINNIYFTGLLF